MTSEQSRVRLEDGLIRFDAPNQSGWEFSVGKIRAIIEYTTEEGPFVSDHFLVFVDGSANEYHLPLDAEGCSELVEQMEKMLESDVNLKLSSSTNFASRVAFPRSIAEAEGYKLEKTRRSLVQRLFHLGQEVTMILSDQVRETVSGSSS